MTERVAWLGGASCCWKVSFLAHWAPGPAVRERGEEERDKRERKEEEEEEAEVEERGRGGRRRRNQPSWD